MPSSIEKRTRSIKYLRQTVSISASIVACLWLSKPCFEPRKKGVAEIVGDGAAPVSLVRSIRGLPCMTSVVGGGGGPPKSRQKDQNQLICDSDKGEGVQKSEDVIYGSPLSMGQTSAMTWPRDPAGYI